MGGRLGVRRVAAGPALPVLLAMLALAALASPPALASSAPPARDDSSSALPGMWWYDKLLVDQAHTKSTGKGVTIGLIDGEIDPTVPELRGQKVTPVHGYCDLKPNSVVATGERARHATSMAALMVGNGRGTGPGGAGIKGIAPDAAVRVYGVNENPAGPEYMWCADSDSKEVHPWNIERAIRAATLDGVDVINMSIGTSPSLTIDDAIRDAQNQGVVVVASAGNSGYDVEYPANAPGVVAVGAVDRQARVWKKSNRGHASVVTAPGVDISAGGFDGTRWDSTVTATGTSGSAALMAGAVALVRSRYPEATPWQVCRHVVFRAGNENRFDWSPEYGFGIVALNKMLETNPSRWRDRNPFAELGPQYFIGSAEDELTGAAATASPAMRPTAEGTPSSAGGEKEAAGTPPSVPLAGAALVAVTAGIGTWRLARTRRDRNRTSEPSAPASWADSTSRGA